MNVQGKVAMITGAAGILGRAVAAALAQAGASLILVDVSDAALKGAYPGSDPKRKLVAVNLLDAVAVQKAVDGIERIDVLCNIAGGFRMGPAVHETPAD